MLKIPVRTCISCREKQAQNLLNRLQCVDKKLVAFNGNGRSFYICNNCLEDHKKLEKSLFKYCKQKDNYIAQLKEIFVDGR